MAAARSPCRCFKTRVLHFKVKNTPLEDKKWKEKVQKNARLSFCGGGKLFIKKSSFEEFNLVFVTAEPMMVLKCDQVSEVLAEFSGTFCTLWPRQLRFLKGIYVFLNVS